MICSGIRPAPACSALLAWLACVGCVAIGPRPTAEVGPSSRELFPLAVGNRWTYDATFLGAHQTLSVSIVSGEGGLYLDSRNQKFILGPDGLRDEHRYLLKEPIAVGHGWTSLIDLSTSEHYKVDEVGVQVEVPAGRFDNCVRIQARSPQAPSVALVAEQIYCPAVGLVRVVTYEEKSGVRGPVQFSQQLSSYRVAPHTP